MKCPQCQSLILLNRGRPNIVVGAPIICPHCSTTFRINRMGQVTMIDARPTQQPTISNIPKTNVNINSSVNPSNDNFKNIIKESNYFNLPPQQQIDVGKRLDKADTQFIANQYVQQRNDEINRIANELKQKASTTPLFENGLIKEDRINNINMDALLRSRELEIDNLKKGMNNVNVNSQSFVINELNKPKVSDEQIRMMDYERQRQNEQFFNVQKRGTDTTRFNNISYFNTQNDNYYQIN